MDETKSKPRPRKTAAKTAAKKVAPGKVAPGKTATAQRSPKASSSVPADRESQVRMVAYLRAERRGFAPGYEVEDWLAAEAEISERVGSGPAPAPRKPVPPKPASG